MAERITDEVARANVAQWAPAFEPAGPYPGATRHWPGRCRDCGASVQPTYHDLQQGGGHCRACGRRRSVESRRLSDEVARARVAEYAPTFQPSVPYPGNNLTPWPGVCTRCDREVTPRFADLQQGKSPCPYCSRRKVDPDEAYLVYVESGGTPLVPYPGKNNLPWPGTCNTCGVDIAPLWGNLRKPGRGVCNACAKRAAARHRHLTHEHTTAVLDQLGFDALDPYPGTASALWRIRHRECGRELQRTYNYLQQGHGCPECQTYYFDLDGPGFVYVVASQEWVKPGITNVPKRRMVEHRMQGLTEVLHLVEVGDGRAALAAEKRWLEMRREHIDPALWPSVDDVPNGYTEAVARTPATDALIASFIASLDHSES